MVILAHKTGTSIGCAEHLEHNVVYYKHFYFLLKLCKFTLTELINA